MPLIFTGDQCGILPDRAIAALAETGGIAPAYRFADDQIQPASLDLRLGKIAYRVRASFLPGPETTVEARINELKLHEFSLAGGAVLETGCVYIVPLIERLALPADVAARTNPKSSTGRLDVFTRVIADQTRGFDRIEAGYHGPLYAEISPRTFRFWCERGRGCHKSASATVRPCWMPRLCGHFTLASGSWMMLLPMSATALA